MSPRFGLLGWAAVALFGVLLGVLASVQDQPWWVGMIVVIAIWLFPIEMLRRDAIKQYKVAEVAKWGKR